MSAVLAPSRARTRTRATALAPAVVALGAWGAVTAVSLSTGTAGDYQTAGPVAGDNPGPAIAELVHGNLAGVASHQPWMGLTSIVLRAPFAAVASLLGDGNLLTYRLGALACMVPLGVLAVWLAARRAAESDWLQGALTALVVLASPVAIDAVRAGHAEEVLAAVLATGAVLAATRDRPGWAAVMLGLAVGTKPWALIGAAPVLSATPGRRAQTAVIAGGLAALLAVSAPLADPAAFSRARHWVDGNLVNAVSGWWPLSAPVHLPSGALAPARMLPLGLTRATASMLVLGVGVVGWALIWARARGRGGSCDALALLALLGAVRCAGDPTTLEYYYAALLVPLATWEAVGLGRVPVVAAAATAAVSLLFGAQHANETVLNSASIAFALVLGAYLTHCAFGARRVPRPATGWRPTTPASEV